MQRIRPLTLVIFLTASAPCFAQGILPAAAAHWKASAAVEFNARNVQAVAGQNAAALAEYGVQSAETRVYKREGNSFAATVYQFTDPSGAFGAYLFLRTPDMRHAKLGKYSAISGSEALTLTGNLVVQFQGKDLRAANDAMDLVAAQAGGHADFGIYPPLAQRLPEKGLIPGTDHYVLGPIALRKVLPLGSGDWLGFYKGAEAVLGEYDVGGRPSTLLIADYPTPQIAETWMKRFEKWFHATDLDNNAVMGSAASAGHRLKMYARRDGTMIALLSGADSEAAADALLRQVHAGYAVTWNAPVLKQNQPSMATIVVGTIVGSGEICAFTLLGGVIFAGLRLLIKKWWPGRVFDRATSLEILELGLTSRPVRTNDLYQLRN